MKTKKLHIIGISTVVLIFSAGLVFASSVGNVLMGGQNAEAVKLLIDCKQEKALAAIEKEEQSKTIKYAKELGLMLKGVIYQELGKTVDLDNLYDEMVVQSGREMSITKSEAVKRVGDMYNELKLERKKKTGSELCK